MDPLEAAKAKIRERAGTLGLILSEVHITDEKEKAKLFELFRAEKDGRDVATETILLSMLEEEQQLPPRLPEIAAGLKERAAQIPLLLAYVDLTDEEAEAQVIARMRVTEDLPTKTVLRHVIRTEIQERERRKEKNQTPMKQTTYASPYKIEVLSSPYNVDDIDIRFRTWLGQWQRSQVRLGKRKRQTDTSPPSSKRAAVGRKAKDNEALPTDESSEKAVGVAAKDAKLAVEVHPPVPEHQWYRGDEGHNFYLRSCVSDLGDLILKRSQLVQDEESEATIYVISGAAGIGKSWSINAFMTVLIDAGKKVFFHSGEQARAWKIEADTLTRVDPANIDALGKEWIYVYDSPGATNLTGDNRAAVPRTGNGKVSLIFSSHKRGNYEHALKKGDGPSTIFNLPTWTKDEMFYVDQGEHTNAINACYAIWGGNMRALNEFKNRYKQNAVAARRKAEEQLDTHIRKIDKEFAKKMVTNLEKQDLHKIFAGEDVQDSPGHILVPEPTETDTSTAECFEHFQWHFCSPLAEKKFFRHLKEKHRDALKDLLTSVFQVPSPKRVLFKKVAHHLVTNGVVQQFSCYPYNTKSSRGSMQFQRCVDELTCEGDDQLKASLKEALGKLDDKIGAVALEPKDTSCDAVDMFVVERQALTGNLDDWCLHMLQDTISKTHSFHPLRVLWYCSVFCAVLKEKFTSAESSDLLERCKYIPVVPHKTSDFSFKPATATCELDELNAVAGLLGFEWPTGYSGKANWKNLVDQHNLHSFIPKTKDGTPRKKFDKKLVCNAMLMNQGATRSVESICHVIFDVVNNVVNG